MKNRYLSIYLSILFLGLLAISSCQEVGQEDLNFVQEESLKTSDPTEYEFRKIRTYFIIEKS